MSRFVENQTEKLKQIKEKKSNTTIEASPENCPSPFGFNFLPPFSAFYSLFLSFFFLLTLPSSLLHVHESQQQQKIEHQRKPLQAVSLLLSLLLPKNHFFLSLKAMCLLCIFTRFYSRATPPNASPSTVLVTLRCSPRSITQSISFVFSLCIESPSSSSPLNLTTVTVSEPLPITDSFDEETRTPRFMFVITR